ncbi:MAG: hypothetical protein ACYDBJ_16180 [Aggregatilineales bacterium]
MLTKTLRRLRLNRSIRGIHGLSVAALLLWLLAGCSLLPVAPTKDTSALSLMPNLAGYTRTDLSTMQGTLANIIAGGALLAANPEISAMVKAGDRLLSCYHNAGAFEADAFINQSDPTLTGAILIINNNAVKDLKILLSCLNLNGNGASVAELQPCSFTYTLNTTGNSYQIMYAATSPTVCAAFCNALQGCIASGGH